MLVEIGKSSFNHNKARGFTMPKMVMRVLESEALALEMTG